MIKSTLLDILSSIRQHKMRSILTGFGIGWGIFILVILLGVSAGTEKGVMKMLEGFAQNSIWFYGGTTKDDDGRRQITFDNKQLQQISSILQEQIIDTTPERHVANAGSITYRQKSRNFTVKAVEKNYFDIKLLKIETGRLFNINDNKEARQVAIIGKRVKEALFEKELPIGKNINIGDEYYKIIGVLKSGSIFDQSEQGTIFIPLQNAAKTYHTQNGFTVFGLSLKQGTNTKRVETRIKHYLSSQLKFNINDKDALYTFNFEEQSGTFSKLFEGLNVFFWFIGVCLLLSGMIGVANIMFVVVKERTKEIGIRKAIGAKPRNIISMILFEAVGITVIAGSIGVILGSGVLKLLNIYLQSSEIIIKDTAINFTIIMGALVILIISGMVAGLIPATNAMKIKPIEAIQSE